MHLEEEHLNVTDNLDFLARQAVEGFLTGMHKSPYHGFSVEFAEHRLYNKGDSLKHIDWKLFARSDKMFVKKFEEETNLRSYIFIDTSSSMLYPRNKQIDKLTLLDKWSDWSFIEVEDGSKDRLVWFSYKDELQDKKMLKIPYHRFRFNILDLKLISERAYQPRGMLSAQLGNYSCVVVKRAF